MSHVLPQLLRRRVATAFRKLLAAHRARRFLGGLGLGGLLGSLLGGSLLGGSLLGSHDGLGIDVPAFGVTRQLLPSVRFNRQRDGKWGKG